MEWLNLIGTLITSGAFVTVFLLGDRKTKEVLENVSKTIDQWKDLCTEMKTEAASLKEDIKEKDNKIDSLYKVQGVLRDKNDKLSSKVAALSILKCKRIDCGRREPPWGSFKLEEKIDISVTEEKESSEES